MDALQLVQAANGGRPAANDDFLVLQSQPLALGLPALLLGMGPCLVSGCRVFQTGSVWNVAPGMVWDGANLLPYLGGSNVSLPAMFAPGAPAVVDERAYQDGTTKTTIKSQRMELVPVVAGSSLVIDTYGALTFWHRVQEKTRSANQVEWVAAAARGNYYASGVGKPGTEAWGWALVDGQGGRVDLLGRGAVALDPAQADYDTIGKQGGVKEVTLDLSQIPSHTHEANFRITDSGASFPFIAAHNSAAGANGANITTKAAGGGLAHENRGPFTTLLARQWIGF